MFILALPLFSALTNFHFCLLINLNYLHAGRFESFSTLQLYSRAVAMVSVRITKNVRSIGKYCKYSKIMMEA